MNSLILLIYIAVLIKVLNSEKKEPFLLTLTVLFIVAPSMTVLADMFDNDMVKKVS